MLLLVDYFLLYVNVVKSFWICAIINLAYCILYNLDIVYA